LIEGINTSEYDSFIYSFIHSLLRIITIAGQLQRAAHCPSDQDSLLLWRRPGCCKQDLRRQFNTIRYQGFVARHYAIR